MDAQIRKAGRDLTFLALAAIATGAYAGRQGVTLETIRETARKTVANALAEPYQILSEGDQKYLTINGRDEVVYPLQRTELRAGDSIWGLVRRLHGEDDELIQATNDANDVKKIHKAGEYVLIPGMEMPRSYLGQ